jgi:adenylosuccinate synthase
MVVDLGQLVAEIETVREVNPLMDVWVDSRAHVVLPLHVQIDGQMEETRTSRIGTTRTGNGPAYAAKAFRLGITVGQALNSSEENLAGRIAEMSRLMGGDAEGCREMAFALRGQVQALGQMALIGDVGVWLDAAWRDGKRLLFAGAHGAMLDIDHGTYPYVTSSNCGVGGIGSTGFDPRKVDRVIGVAKAYSTRIGTGPFPQEMVPREAYVVRKAGREYGTTTGRPRRIGWFDLASLEHAVRVNGCDAIALTLVDVLASLRDWKVLAHFRDRQTCGVPEYAESPSWQQAVFEDLPPLVDEHDVTMLSAARRVAELPPMVQDLMNRITVRTNVPIMLVSNGPAREDVLWTA